MHGSTTWVNQSTSDKWLQPPPWVDALLGRATLIDLRPGHEGITGHRRQSHEDNWLGISVRVARAAALPPLDLQRATVHAYRTIRSALIEDSYHPVRFWNFIPAINQLVDERTDRYMVFNAGRYAAYLEWHGDEEFPGDIATASGVGHTGTDLFIHCLARSVAGVAVENPRQIPAYRYSPRYGPFPPGFTRATIVQGSAGIVDQLYIGGTASICGEHSLHVCNLQRQTRETLRNLAAVVKSGAARRDGSVASGHVNGDMRYWLSLLRTLRVYYVRPEHRSSIESMLADTIGNNCAVEWVRADLCRPELLVEIEGVADLPPLLSAAERKAAGRSGA